MKKTVRTLLCLASALVVCLLTGCDDKEEKPASLVELARPVSSAVVASQTGAPVKLPVVFKGVTPGSWTIDYEAACEYAKEHKLPILLYFCRSDASQECQALSRDVFLKDEWREFAASHLVLVYVDFPSQPPEEIRDDPAALELMMRQNIALNQQYGVQGVPALLMVEADGTPVGEVSPESKESMLTAVVRNVRRALRQREAYLESLLARMPEDQAAAIRAKRERMNELQAESEKIRLEANRRLQELAAEAGTLRPEIETAMIDWLMAEHRTPEIRAKYAAAKAALDKGEGELKKWLEGNPPQTAENNAIYANFQEELAKQRNIIADCVAGDE